MERIEELLARPQELTYSQRVLWEENQNLIIGKAENIRTLTVRPHHFWGVYQAIVEEWEKYHIPYFLNKKLFPVRSFFKSPWKYTEFEKFDKNSHEFATTFSKFVLSVSVDRLAEAVTNKDKEKIKYWIDVIGKTKEERFSSLVSNYLYTRNFLLRVFRDSNQTVVLKAVVDDICTSCRGVTGDHCKKDMGEEKANLFRILNYFRANAPEHFLKMKKHKKGIAIPLYYFFDDDIRKQLVNMRFKRRHYLLLK